MTYTLLNIKKFTGEVTNCMDAVALQHTMLLEKHPKAYVEICVQRGTDVNSWLTTDLVDDDSTRKVITHSSGQGCFNRAARNLCKDSPVFDAGMKAQHPHYRRQEVTLKLFNKYDDILRNQLCFHYLQFYMYCKPQVGWKLELNTHWNEKHENFKRLLDITEETHTDLLNRAFIEIEQLIEKEMNA